MPYKISSRINLNYRAVVEQINIQGVIFLTMLIILENVFFLYGFIFLINKIVRLRRKILFIFAFLQLHSALLILHQKLVLYYVFNVGLYNRTKVRILTKILLIRILSIKWKSLSNFD